MKNEIELTNEIQTACLPSKDSKLALNTSVYIAGWGSIQNRSNSGDQPEPINPAFLQNVKINILRASDCDSSSLGGGQITDAFQICAGKIKLYLKKYVYLFFVNTLSKVILKEIKIHVKVKIVRLDFVLKNQIKSSFIKLGDSGGPLYDTDSSRKHVVAGSVSYGLNGCGSAGIPQG